MEFSLQVLHGFLFFDMLDESIGRAFFSESLKLQSNACFSFLHNIGYIVYNFNTKKICTDPALLARIMACFVFNPDHDLRIYQATSTPGLFVYFYVFSIS